MDIEHTKEPWFSDGECIWRRHPRELYQNGGGVAGDKPLASLTKGWFGDGESGYPVEANARRIVACVNACAEIGNKELEAVSYAQLLESHHLLQSQVASAEVLVGALKTISHDAHKELKKYRTYTGMDNTYPIDATKYDEVQNMTQTNNEREVMIEDEFNKQYPYDDMEGWDRNLFKSGYQAATKSSEKEINSLKERVEELQADNNQLREALELVRKEYEGLPHSLGYEFTHLPIINKALSSTPA